MIGSEFKLFQMLITDFQASQATVIVQAQTLEEGKLGNQIFKPTVSQITIVKHEISNFETANQIYTARVHGPDTSLTILKRVKIHSFNVDTSTVTTSAKYHRF